MKKISVISLILLFVVLAAVGAARASTAIIPVDEIEPGMKGYGMTVLQGTEPVRFEVEVIDVLERVFPSQDMILVRCSGQNLEKTRIIAGMSGSPVYIEGRLAGAVAYGWSFSMDPIAGITPIQNMLGELERPLLVADASLPAQSSSGLSPITTPLMVSGLSHSAMQLLEESLEPFHMIPIASGAASSRDTASVELKPGSAIGGTLVSGDLNMTAVGTLTYMDGNTVLAFGHPFLYGGELNIPLVSAKVHTVMASQSISFKMASPIEQVGLLTQDRLPCIAGRLDKRAEMVPYHFSIRDTDSGFSQGYDMQIIQHHLLTPVFVDVALRQSLQAAAASKNPTTVTLKNTINLEGYPPVSYQDTYSSLAGPANPGLSEAVAFLVRNPFKQVKLESVEFEMETSPGVQVAAIQGLWAESERVVPGRNAILHVNLKPYNSPIEDWILEIPVPEDYRQSRLTITVKGGGQTRPDTAKPESVEDLISFIDALYPSQSIVAGFRTPAAGLDYRGLRLEQLPPSIGSILNPPNASESKRVPGLKRVVKKVPYVVSGTARISLKVEKEVKP